VQTSADETAVLTGDTLAEAGPQAPALAESVIARLRSSWMPKLRALPTAFHQSGHRC
jgi:hypothetical protein